MMDWLPHAFVMVGIAYVAYGIIKFRDRHGDLLFEIERSRKRQIEIESQIEVEGTLKEEKQQKVMTLEEEFTNGQNRVAEVKDQITQAQKREEDLSMELYNVSKGKA
jgi:seryl-tRNA synthetase